MTELIDKEIADCSPNPFIHAIDQFDGASVSFRLSRVISIRWIKGGSTGADPEKTELRVFLDQTYESNTDYVSLSVEAGQRLERLHQHLCGTFDLECGKAATRWQS